MDFIGPFPEVDGYNYLWVVICHLTSMVHLVLVSTTTTASQLLVIYMHEIMHLHGLPSSIVSDQDAKFMSKWWHELHKLMGMKLMMSTLFHPQTDGIAEQVNRSIAQIFHPLAQTNRTEYINAHLWSLQ
jgi:transposase InsO family protein